MDVNGYQRNENFTLINIFLKEPKKNFYCCFFFNFTVTVVGVLFPLGLILDVSLDKETIMKRKFKQ